LEIKRTKFMWLNSRGFEMNNCRNCKKEIKWDFDNDYCEMCYPDYDYYITDINF